MALNQEIQPIEILLVEDNVSEVRLTQLALGESSVANRLSVVSDGVEALDFLRRAGRHVEAPRPDIILLDLNLPRKRGVEVLSEIRADPALKNIPVLVLTNSRNERDINESYGLQANCYISKPVDLEGFFTVVKAIEQFWLRTARLPPVPS